MEDKLFDVTAQFELKHLGEKGIETVSLSWPSDDDWCEREARRKQIIGVNNETDDGRRLDPDEEELVLVQKLCPDLGNIDPFEASRLLDALAFTEVLNIESIVSSHGLDVELQVIGAKTIHRLRMPSAKDLDRYERSRFDQRPHSKNKISSVRNLRGLAKIYDDLVENFEGYVGSVPIIHKYAVVFVAFHALQTELATDPNP